MTAQKDTNKGIISDSQVNSNFPYRWSLASLAFNVYFYLFLYLYITRITVNIITPHLKSPKNQNRGAALGRPAQICFALLCHSISFLTLSKNHFTKIRYALSFLSVNCKVWLLQILQKSHPPKQILCSMHCR